MKKNTGYIRGTFVSSDSVITQVIMLNRLLTYHIRSGSRCDENKAELLTESYTTGKEIQSLTYDSSPHFTDTKITVDIIIVNISFRTWKMRRVTMLFSCSLPTQLIALSVPLFLLHFPPHKTTQNISYFSSARPEGELLNTFMQMGPLLLKKR